MSDPLNQGLVYWMPGLVAGGSKSIDVTPYGHHGSDQSATPWAPGWAPGFSALDLDGSNDYHALDSATRLRPLTSSFTISAWVKPDTVSGSGYIMSWDRAGSSFRGWGWYRNGARQSFVIYGVAVRNCTFTDFAVGEWSMVTMVFDSDSDCHFYKDGEFNQTATGSTDPSDPVTDGFEIGRQAPSGGYFDGCITDCKVWGRMLSPSEIRQNHLASLAGYPTQFRRPKRAKAKAPSGGATTVTVQSALHAHSADSPSITQTHEIATDDATHAHAVDSPAITQTHQVAVAEATHSHTADNVTVTAGTVVTPNEATHSHAADAPAVTQTHVIATDDASHSHTVDSPAVTQTHVIAVDEANHAHQADLPAISQTHIITVDEATHGHAAGNVTVDVNAVAITVNEAVHSHTADSPGITQTHVLVVNDALHAHLADGVTISFAGVTLDRFYSIRIRPAFTGFAEVEPAYTGFVQ